MSHFINHIDLNFMNCYIMSVSNCHEVLTAESLEQSDDDEQKAEQREVISQLCVLTENT